MVHRNLNLKLCDPFLQMDWYNCKNELHSFCCIISLFFGISNDKLNTMLTIKVKWGTGGRISFVVLASGLVECVEECDS